MIYYFAYGSNLHPLRLIERVPSAEFVCVTEFRERTLSFHKRSHDGSSKCNILKTKSGLVYGAIYKMDAEHKSELDRFEGEGYFDNQVTLKHNDNEINCFTYLAQESHIVDNLQPYHWYKQLVLLGAQYLKFPEAYITSIEKVDSIEDPDTSRRQEKESLIKRIHNYR